MAIDWTAGDTDYRDMDECAALVKEKTGLNPSDLKTQLLLSAGVDPNNTTIYRPYFVAGWFLRTRKSQLVRAEGAEWIDPLRMADQFMVTQASIDRALNLTVPEGYEATRDNTRLGNRRAGSGPAPLNPRW